MKLKPLRPESNELLHLDAMRFIAAAGIVLHHSQEFFHGHADRALAGAHSAGLALFVDLFFTISGYVIAHVYADRITDLRSFGTFIQRRIGRLGPLHWVTFALSASLWAFLAYFQVSATHTPSFKVECLVETITLTHALYPCGGLILNGQSWSISAEMAMYVSFPIFLAIGRRSPLYLLTLAAGVATAIVGFNHGLPDATTSIGVWVEAYSPLRATVSFCIGITLWLMRPALERLPLPEIVLYISVPALCIVMQTMSNAFVAMALVYIVVCAAIVADLRGKTSYIFRAIAPLGQLTYSIYMWHGLFILVFMNIIGDKVLRLSTVAMICVAIITYVMILSWSYFSFIYLETPARKWIDRLKVAPATTSLSKSRAG